MAYSLIRQVPEARDDGRAAALLARLGAAAGEAGTLLGARPPVLREIVDALATGTPLPVRGRRRLPLHAALDGVRAAVFEAPGRDREARLLWREALATAWLSGTIARLAGGSPGTAGVAGLLHRAGEALALRIVAEVEVAEGLRLELASVHAACAMLEPGLGTALAREWRLQPGIVTALQGWRRVGEGGATSAESRAVHYAHAFASQILFAEFPAPGLADAAESALRLDRRELSRLRAGFEPLRVAVESLE